MINCSPAKGHPAKYYFAGTPKAGAQAARSAERATARCFSKAWTPAFAGEQGGTE